MICSAVRSGWSAKRSAFTLVEMLVAITIFAILATIAITSLSDTGNDRVPAAARQLRSMLGGSQSRAAKSKSPRGVRLLVEPGALPNMALVKSLVYVGTNQDIAGDLQSVTTASGRNVQLNPSGIGWEIQQAASEPVLWSALAPVQLKVGQRIFLTWERQHGTQEFIINAISAPDKLIIVGHEAPRALDGKPTYRLELEPEILSNNEPVTLPRGTVIDLDASSIPSSFRPTVAKPYVDLMFGPRGSLWGDLATSGSGPLHFYVGDEEDCLTNRPSPAPTPYFIATAVRPRRVVSILPGTGQIVPSEYNEASGSQFLFGENAKEAQ